VPHQLSPVTPLADTGRVNVAQTLLSVLVMLGTFEKLKCDASGVKLEG
jgi:hypothetical protein